MKNLRNYTINYATEEIIITKKFGKAASQIGSPEFKIMKELRAEFTGFSISYKAIKKKKGNKKSYKGLTIEEMIRFVSGISNEDKDKFEKVIEVASNRQGKYPIIKKFFLDNYKEAYESEIDNIKKDKDTNDSKDTKDTIDSNDTIDSIDTEDSKDTIDTLDNKKIA